MKKVLIVLGILVFTTGCGQKLKVGDYIAYDAGNWSSEDASNYSTSERKETKNQFYIYNLKEGQSKNSSVEGGCYKDDNYTNNSGWRVLSTSNDQITIIHAGVPACYSFSMLVENVTLEDGVNAMDDYNNLFFNNSEYVQEVRNVKCSDFFSEDECVYGEKGIGSVVDQIKPIPDIYNLKDNYWLSTSSNTGRMWNWNVDYNYFSNHHEHMYGIRPVIVLKKEVVLDGSGDGSKENPYGIKIK